MTAAAEMPDPIRKFEQIYERSDDPWDYRTSDYEREKYQATLAAIPEARNGRCLEVGCSIGVFTKLLAQRCRSVVAIDFSQRAIELAVDTLAEVDNVELHSLSFPDQVPGGPWDVILCSEVLYYLDEERLEEAIGWLSSQLDSGTCVIAVSWRGSDGEPLRGDDVHDLLAARFAAHHTLDARRPGYRLDRFERVV